MSFLQTADTDNFCDMLTDILDVLDRRKYADSDVRIPPKYVSMMNIDMVADRLDEKIDYINHAEFQRIWKELKSHYGPAKDAPSKEMEDQIRLRFSEKVPWLIKAALSKGRLPLSVSSEMVISHDRGKETIKPIPLAVLEYPDYLLQVSFSRDNTKYQCSIHFRIIFTHSLFVLILRWAFGAQAENCLRSDSADKRLRNIESAKQVSRDFARYLKQERTMALSRGIVTESGIQVNPKPSVTEFQFTMKFLGKSKLTDILRHDVPAAMKISGFSDLEEDLEEANDEGSESDDDDGSPFASEPQMDIAIDTVKITVSLKNTEMIGAHDILLSRFQFLYEDIVERLLRRLRMAQEKKVSGKPIKK